MTRFTPRYSSRTHGKYAIAIKRAVPYILVLCGMIVLAGTSRAETAPKNAPKTTSETTAKTAPKTTSETTPKDWPCDQIYRKNVAVATLWQGPDIGKALDQWWSDNRIFNVVESLKDPTLTEDTIRTMIADYAQTLKPAEKKEKLTLLFAGLYQRSMVQRRQQLTGILNFVSRQKKITEKISSVAQRLRAMRRDNVDPKSAQYREVEAEMEWNTRVFDERQRLTYYVCEQPILLVQRLGVATRAIMAAIEAKPPS